MSDKKDEPVEETPNGSSLPLPLPSPPETSGPVPPKTLWMGDIEPWWDESFIVEVWAKLGLRVLVKVIKPKKSLIMRHMAKSHDQGALHHSGYCFVEFESPELAKKALALNGKPIPDTGGKLFRLNWATAATLNSQVQQTPEYSLFVGDLSPGTTEAHLLALFQNDFDTVKTVRVMTDPATGMSRCFGFVRFANEQDRSRALVEMDGKWLGGRPIRVALATPKNQGFNQLAQDPSEYLPMGYYPPMPYQDINNTTVFVGGLSPGVSEETLQTLFEPFGTIIHVRVPQGKGCGFIKFENRESAERAVVGMQGFVINGSRIRLSWGRPSNGRQRHQRVPQSQQFPLYYDPYYAQMPMTPQSNGNATQTDNLQPIAAPVPLQQPAYFDQGYMYMQPQMMPMMPPPVQSAGLQVQSTAPPPPLPQQSQSQSQPQPQRPSNSS